MPDIASVLKSEIARIARKEIRAEIDSLKKAVGTYRTEIAALKRRAQTLEQELKRVLKAGSNPQPPENDSAEKKLRFSSKGLAKQRQRLGLSAEAVGVLVGASGQSVYNWEAGSARPRAAHLAAIAALRGLSKTQAAAVLDSRRASSTEAKG
ncbi:helix-turn-helix domain-containing protein [Rhizobacter fulvus]|jgi:DNA-binding transcriptional regulator YiaG